MIVAGAMGMPGGCLLFIPLYHPLHDFFGVPSEVTSITVLLIFAAIVWKHDRHANRYAKPKKYLYISYGFVCNTPCQFFQNGFSIEISNFPSNRSLCCSIGYGYISAATGCNIGWSARTYWRLHRNGSRWNCAEGLLIWYKIVYMNHENNMIFSKSLVKTLSKRKYLCVSDYDEKYYDFHCLPGSKVPSQGSYWYTICGTDHE